MRKLVRLTGVALTLLLASGAAAQDFGRSGAYAGAGWSRAVEDIDDIDPFDLDDGRAIHAMAGYRVDRFLAVELEIESVDDLDDEELVLGTNVGLDAELWSVSIIGKVYPLSGRFQPYLLGGVGYADGEIELSVESLGLDVDEDGQGTILHAGVGLDVYMTENLLFEVEWSYRFLTSELDGFDFWTVGGALIYRF